ncbi:hypothetical protein E2C01_060702 [Portunus trituberculatus]|uniref:Uncharacterized protein n=1 Tax=Portunus trituberculatus TaxID=210409 RepID=A0A5B7H8V4_PORTR|nr:hypothetical protein [Portunus trituberculatus]
MGGEVGRQKGRRKRGRYGGREGIIQPTALRLPASLPSSLSPPQRHLPLYWRQVEAQLLGCSGRGGGELWQDGGATGGGNGKWIKVEVVDTWGQTQTRPSPGQDHSTEFSATPGHVRLQREGASTLNYYHT